MAVCAPNFSSTSWRVCLKSAPILSILLTKQIRGTLYLSAWRQTVSDCDCTPSSASRTVTPPSSTRSERSTSAVKSTCPGVSMRLIRCWSVKSDLGSLGVQKVVVAAETIVMPRSFSCSIQSIWVLPSSMSPIL